MWRWLKRFWTKPLPSLPKGVRYFKPRSAPRKGVLIVEREPVCRTISTQEEKHFLSFPYQVFIIQFGRRKYIKQKKYEFYGLQIGFRSDSLKKASDYLYSLPLSNYSPEYLTVCMGNPGPGGTFDTLEQMVQAVIGYFWNSTFSSLDHPLMAKWKESGPNSVMKPANSLRCVAKLSSKEELSNVG